MDVQGAEYLVLQGMKETINKNSNLYLLTEFWPYAIEKSGHSPKEFIEQLKQLDFKIFKINEDKKEEFDINDDLIYDYDLLSQASLFCEKLT